MALDIDELIETLQTYAECNMNAKEAGERLFITPAPMLYRLEKIRKLTGLNPRNFFDLVKLMEYVKTGKIKNMLRGGMK